MNNTDIDLSPFCGKAYSYWEWMKAPLAADGYIVATDRHIIVRLADSTSRAHNHAVAQKMQQLFDEGAFEPAGFSDLPEIPASSKCKWCDGTGVITEDGDDFPCSECNGTGAKVIRVRVGEAIFNAYYLSLISSLPNAKINAPTKDGAAAFVFDGGDGRLMPLRQE